MAKKDNDVPAEDVTKKPKKKDGAKGSSKKSSSKSSKDGKKKDKAVAAPQPVIDAAPAVEVGATPEPVAAQPVAAQPVAPQPAPPQVVFAPAPKRKGRGGLVAIILAELVALVGGLVVLALILFNVSIPWPWATKTEVALEAAAVVGTAPFNPTNFATELDTEFSLPAMEALPESGVSLSAVVLDGSSSEIYVRTVNGVENYCNRDGIADFFASDAAAAAAFIAVMADEKASPKTTYDAATLADEIRLMFRAQLISDTIVVQHGLVDGETVPLPAVLQKGTWVLADEYGVPRLKCNGANPLTVAESVGGTTVFTGSAWADFDPARIVSIKPAPEIQDYFVVTNRLGEKVGILRSGFNPPPPTAPACLPNLNLSAVPAFSITNSRDEAAFLYFVNSGDDCEMEFNRVLLPGATLTYPDNNGWSPFPNQSYYVTDAEGNLLGSVVIDGGTTELKI